MWRNEVYNLHLCRAVDKARDLESEHLHLSPYSGNYGLYDPGKLILSGPLCLDRQMGRIKCSPHDLVMRINYTNVHGSTALLSSAK